ncbi:MAG: hypothetical protein M3680_34855, partial [Myxococcota bacterium]|nr:hypothetical protein [Myxococcota bacterium]
TAGLTTGAIGPPTAVERKTEPALAPLNKAAIEAALGRARHDVNVAARALGLHRARLYELMDELAIVYTDEG